MAIVWLGMCEFQLKMQREKMSATLRAARLAKEAVDQYVITGQNSLTEDHLKAKVCHQRVIVRQDGTVIYEVRG